ncbi:MAG: hypothetical protein D3905_07965 [Candidatus Electrothrix sp. AS4_5]|nr:hypothetical protein [Candidatus Electrothrix gigas]
MFIEVCLLSLGVFASSELYKKIGSFYGEYAEKSHNRNQQKKKEPLMRSRAVTSSAIPKNTEVRSASESLTTQEKSKPREDPKSVQKLRVSTMSECEYFGMSISASGNTVAIDSHELSTNQFDVVYIMTRDDTFCWHPQAKLNIPKINFFDSVSLSSDTLAVGAADVYIFVRSGTSWSQQAKLSIPDADWLDSVSLSGDTLAVSTRYDGSSDDSPVDATVVHIFVRSGTSWSQQAKLSIPDTSLLDGVSLSGETLAVGTSSRDAVHIFVRSGTSWSQQAKLSIPDTTSLDSISLSGETLAVGTSSRDAVHIFVRSGSSWSQQAKLNIPLGTDRLDSVSLSGNTLAVSARYDDSSDDANVVHIFVRSGTSWSQQTKLANSHRSAAVSGQAVFTAYKGYKTGTELYIYSENVCIQKNALSAITLHFPEPSQ